MWDAVGRQGASPVDPVAAGVPVAGGECAVVGRWDVGAALCPSPSGAAVKAPVKVSLVGGSDRVQHSRRHVLPAAAPNFPNKLEQTDARLRMDEGEPLLNIEAVQFESRNNKDKTEMRVREAKGIQY
jgi:hypothetical protein